MTGHAPKSKAKTVTALILCAPLSDSSSPEIKNAIASNRWNHDSIGRRGVEAWQTSESGSAQPLTPTSGSDRRIRSVQRRASKRSSALQSPSSIGAHPFPWPTGREMLLGPCRPRCREAPATLILYWPSLQPILPQTLHLRRGSAASWCRWQRSCSSRRRGGAVSASTAPLHLSPCHAERKVLSLGLPSEATKTSLPWSHGACEEAEAQGRETCRTTGERDGEHPPHVRAAVCLRRQHWWTSRCPASRWPSSPGRQQQELPFTGFPPQTARGKYVNSRQARLGPRELFGLGKAREQLA